MFFCSRKTTYVHTDFNQPIRMISTLYVHYYYLNMNFFFYYFFYIKILASIFIKPFFCMQESKAKQLSFF